MKVISLFALAALPVVDCAAQIPLYPLPTRGVMSSFPVGMVWTGDQTEIRRKQAGLPAVLDTFTGTGGPTAASRPGKPEYTMQNVRLVLQALATQQNQLPVTVPALQVDAMSTGNDVLPMYYDPNANNGNGEFRIHQGMAGGWAVLYLVVEPPAAGFPYDSGEVLGYYFDNPVWPAQLRNGIYHEVRRDDLAAVDALDGQEIAALDVAMGLIEASDGVRERGIIEVIDRLYFSLTPATAVALDGVVDLNLDVQGQPPYTQPFDGATIFVAEFDIGTGSCTNVMVHTDAAGLLLEAGADVDALGIGTIPGAGTLPGWSLTTGQKEYLVSTTTPTTGVEELMVTASVQDPQGPTKRRRRLRANSGNAILANGGTLQGKIKALCTQDPDGFGNGYAAFGEPDPDPLTHPFDGSQVTSFMNLSLTARTDPTSGTADIFHLTGVVSGWTGPAADSLCVLAIELAGVTQHMAMFPIRLGSEGHHEFNVPCNFPFMIPGTPMSNAFRFHVIQADVSTGALTFSLPGLLRRWQ